MTTKSNDQIGLFTTAETFVPSWLKRSTSEFDPVLAAKFKHAAMASAAASPAHQELLNLLRPALRELALARADRCACADDAQRWLVEHGHSPASLGNAAGSLFRGSEWELVGYRPSARVSRHRSIVGIWRLTDGG